MWFGVLGHLEVCGSDGAPISITAPAQRQLLAALVARAGSLVTAATLIDDLWGAGAPRSAVGSLRSHVARLRDGLGRGEAGAVLATDGNGYRLCVTPDSVDAGRFETLVQQGDRATDPPAAIEAYDHALGLWRDEAYVEFGDAPFAVLERIRLAELRASARERRTGLALQIGLAGELVAELEQRVRTEPYRERGWEQLALALYRDGRQADALAACRRARAVLAEDLGVDPGPGLRDLEERLLRQDPELLITAPAPAVARPVIDRCPYLGLAGYEEQDAALFVGRERLTSTLAGRLADQSVLVVTGASGVGKSSLVRAGLVPALRAGALPGSASWRIDVHTPTTADDLDERRRPELIVLDQAEELFTGLATEQRDELVARLVQYVRYGGGRLVLVLRSDFYGRLAEIESLAPFAEQAALLVGPMRADELRRALLEPAAAAGLRLEDELVETVLDDVAGQPEPLPLLSEAMVHTWHRRDGVLLTLDGYRRSGGLAGALEAAAEECYTRLDADARRAARHVLVRMAVPSGTGGWVRRPLGRADLPESGPEREALDALVAARLAIVAEQHIQLVHDALLERWPRLRDWLDERALAAELVDHLDKAATAWRTSGRQDADLYRGPRLSAAIEWRAEHPADVSSDEQDFLDASARAAEVELQAARAQAAGEARGRRRLRRVAVALAAVVVLALAGGAIALFERSAARTQAHLAEQAALTADANRLAALARSLPGDQRDVALLLGAEGYELQSSDQTAGGLQSALMQTPPGLDRVIRFRSASRFPHLDHTGRRLAVPGADGSVVIYDLARSRVLQTLTWHSARQFAVFSGDDRFVAAGGADGTVAVWDAQTGRRSGVPLRSRGGAVRPIFDPRDDNRLYVLSARGTLAIWDRSDPEHPHIVGWLEGIQTDGDANLTISADGRFIAAGDLQSGISGATPRVWDTLTRTALPPVAGSIGNLAADGTTLPIGFGDDTVLRNVRTGRVEDTIRGTGGAALATLSPDRERVAIPEQLGDASVVTVYDLQTHRRIGQPLALHNNSAYALGFLPDGRVVTTGPTEAAIWTLGKDLPPLGVRLDTSIARAGGSGLNEQPVFLPRSRNVVVLGNSGPILHDPTTGRPVGMLAGGGVGDPLAGSPDGRLLVGEVHGEMGIWDVAEQRVLAVLPWYGSKLRVVVHAKGSPQFAVDLVSGLDWSPRGNAVAAVVGGRAYLWDVSDPRRPSEPVPIGDSRMGVIDNLQVMPDGRRVVLLSDAATRLSLVDSASGRTVWTRRIGDVGLNQFAISPDGSRIAYDSGDLDAGQLVLLDAATGEQDAAVAVPSDGGIGYLNGGRWLVVTSNQPQPAAQLYDGATLQPFGVPFPTADVDQEPLAVDPAGTRFAEPVSYDYHRPLSYDPYLWNADPATWIHTACAIAGRNLTRAEWQQYLPERPYRKTCTGWPAAG